MNIYEPREDSFLLKKFVKKFAKGVVLDMGTGSGILAAEAAFSKKVVKVFAVDINEDAIIHCIRTHKSNKILFAESNLFSLFEDYALYRGIKFDVIIFNAPYLPTDRKYPDVALDGGRLGHELICKFLHASEKYLKPNGRILLLFSSHTGKERVDNFLFRHHWEFTELGRQQEGFEDLFAYSVLKLPKTLKVEHGKAR